MCIQIQTAFAPSKSLLGSAMMKYIIYITMLPEVILKFLE